MHSIKMNIRHHDEEDWQRILKGDESEQDAHKAAVHPLDNVRQRRSTLQNVVIMKHIEQEQQQHTNKNNT